MADTTPQGHANEAFAAFVDHDKRNLDNLSDDDLEAQYRARRALFDYVDEIWEGAKSAGLNPATKPDWNAVAGLRDLTMGLRDLAMFKHFARQEDA